MKTTENVFKVQDVIVSFFILLQKTKFVTKNGETVPEYEVSL